MEVASPLTFQPAGSKRSFACSPTMDMSSDDLYDYTLQASSKRRRFDHMNHNHNNASPTVSSNFPAAFTNSANRSTSFGVGPAKRSRTDSGNYSDSHNSFFDSSAASAELASLKDENTKLVSTIAEMKQEHAKVLHENKVLKKLVSHQHGNQVQTLQELEAAKKYKVEAEDRMSKMEQMILQLRYHLQTVGTMQGSHDSFMGMRPPDVY